MRLYTRRHTSRIAAIIEGVEIDSPAAVVWSNVVDEKAEGDDLVVPGTNVSYASPLFHGASIKKKG